MGIAEGSRRQRFVPLLLLALLTVGAFLPVLDNGFVGFDDDPYIVENPRVRAGLTWEGLRWAFASFGHASNWHPLTWLSHMLDVQLFGLDPRGHHLSSLLLHLANALLLFGVLRAATGAAWRSFLVSSLFAVHPLHVESVAWAAERKDLLSTFFGLLAVAAYLRAVRRRDAGSFALCVGAFALGLLAKPMLVTLPFVLLLLDWWPLGRLAPSARASAGGRPLFWRPLLEKIPLLALSAASSVVTWLVQERVRAAWTLEALPPATRLANALGAYFTYLRKAAWPADLAVFYPLAPAGPPARETALLAALFVAVCVAVVALRRRGPYAPVGWFWYLGTLVPVIGLLQVGRQAMADRYTYLPLTGLFIVVAWSLPDLVPRRHRGALLAVPAAAALLLLAGLTRQQARHWRDSTALFEHSLAVTGDNVLARSNLLNQLAAQGRHAEVVERLSASLRADPRSVMTRINLAGALYRSGALDRAVGLYREVIAEGPAHPEVYNNLGCALFAQGKVEESVRAWREALRIDPRHVSAHFNLAQVLEKRGARAEAGRHYREALRLQPDHPGARLGLARTR